MKTGMKAWVGQRQKDIARNGKKKSPWLVFWNEPDGTRREKSCGPGKEGWQLAQKEKVRIHNELVSGTYKSRRSRSWTEFRENFEAKVVVKKAPRTQKCDQDGTRSFWADLRAKQHAAHQHRND